MPKAEESRMTFRRTRSFSRVTLVLAVLAALLQPGCLFRKKSSAPKYPPEPIRIALLPFTVPSDNAELRWASLAGPIIMAKAESSRFCLSRFPSAVQRKRRARQLSSRI